MSTSNLFVGKQEIRNIFELLGDDEDSISLSIAWALSRAPAFLKNVITRVANPNSDTQDIQIHIHRYEKSHGITDIEILAQDAIHIIIEAKKGWVLPSKKQLTLYATRPSFASSDAAVKKIVTLSECSQTYAHAHLPAKVIDGIPVIHVSWEDIINDAEAAQGHGGRFEKRLLSNLVRYLRLVMTGQQKDSNLVYVVSLASSTPNGWDTSWIAIVTKYARYFHPVGNHWPKSPPNYIAFRYRGQLQSIHHIEKYEVIHNLSEACPGIPDSPVGPHYLYTLGSAIKPSQIVRNGSVYPSGRVWCAIDTLLTSASVSDARDETQARGVAV